MTKDNLSFPVKYETMPNPQACKQKSVEGKLWRTLRSLADTEANVYLFSTLRSLGLATNDVRNFVDKQAKHKKMNKLGDSRVKRQCMQSKLVDAYAYAKKLRQIKSLQKKRIH